MALSLETKRELLRLARRTLESHLAGQRSPAPESLTEDLTASRGAFVTLRRRGQLRGCIGSLVAERPLWQTVREMAIQAATEDPRFSPVSATELPDLEIEISALSPLGKIRDPNEIEVGEHGIVVSKGGCRGVLLPQVAAEEGWDRETFLGMTCLKAGLPVDSWKEPGLEIWIFSADVFGEDELR